MATRESSSGSRRSARRGAAQVFPDRKTRRTTAPGFPRWAPVAVIDRLNKERARLDALSRPPPGNFTKGGEYQQSRERQRRALAASCELMYRLLTYDDMLRVWDALQSSQQRTIYGLDSKAPQASGFSQAEAFVGAALHGFRGPWGEARLTHAEHRAFLADVQKQCEKLSKMLRGTDLDQRLISRLEVSHHETGRMVWPCFSDMLDSVASGARYFATASAAKRTHGEHARRAYFVRHLTGFFREYLGGPRRELVAIATAVAFDDASFSKRQVQRLAP